VKAIRLNKPSIRFGAALLLFLAVEYCIAQWIYLSRNPDLFSAGVAIDLTLGIPVLFYFLVVRPKHFTLLSLLPVFFLSLWIATLLIPSAHQSFLKIEKLLIPVIEIALVVYVVSRIPAIVKTYRRVKNSEIYFIDSVHEAAAALQLNQKLLRIVITEFILLYLSFVGWFKRFEQQDRVLNVFTYHIKSGYSAILAVMAFLLIVETVVIHLILLQWSSVGAFVVTALSIYSLFWLIGDYHAIRIHPVAITESKLLLRTGVRWKADIPLTEISDVITGGSVQRKSKGYVRASVLWPRVTLILSRPVAIQGMFGIVRKASRIGLSIDDIDQFRAEILKNAQPSKNSEKNSTTHRY
jgi:hypothetical protein